MADLAGLARGYAHHLFGETLGNELVRMVLAEQAPLGLFDLFIGCRGWYFEHRIGTRKGMIPARLRDLFFGRIVCSRPGLCLQTLIFRGCDAESVADVQEQFLFAGMQRSIRIGGGQLDFDKHAQQVLAVPCFFSKLPEHLVQRKAGLLAMGEETHGGLFLGRQQGHLTHHLAGGFDLVGRDPPVGFTEVSHDREGGGKESGLRMLLPVRASGSAAMYRLRVVSRLFVEAMP